MLSKRIILFTAATSALSAGCATSPETCNPTEVKSVFTASKCLLSGDMKEAVQQQRKRLDRLIEQHQLTELQIEYLKSMTSEMAEDNDIYQKQLRYLAGEVNKLQVTWNKLKPEADDMIARQAVVLEELSKLESRLSKAQNISATNEAEILTLTKQVERRRAVLKALSVDYVIE